MRRGLRGLVRRAERTTLQPSSPPASPSALCPQLVYPSDFRLTDKEVGPALWGADGAQERASPHRVSCVSEKQHLLPVLS